MNTLTADRSYLKEVDLKTYKFVKFYEKFNFPDIFYVGIMENRKFLISGFSETGFEKTFPVVEVELPINIKERLEFILEIQFRNRKISYPELSGVFKFMVDNKIKNFSGDNFKQYNKYLYSINKETVLAIRNLPLFWQTAIFKYNFSLYNISDLLSFSEKELFFLQGKFERYKRGQNKFKNLIELLSSFKPETTVQDVFENYDLNSFDDLSGTLEVLRKIVFKNLYSRKEVIDNLLRENKIEKYIKYDSNLESDSISIIFKVAKSKDLISSKNFLDKNQEILLKVLNKIKEG